MKNKCLFITLALGVSLTLVLLWLLSISSTAVTAAPVCQSQQATADVITVCVSGGCDHSSIQAAVDAAGDGDVIKVAAGTYTDVHVRRRNDVTTTGVVTQMVYISKTVTIQGGYTATNWTAPDPEANPTTLDAGRQGRVLYIAGEINPTVEGLRITGGDADGLGGDPGGEDAGGGVYAITATVTLSDCWLHDNHTDGDGGGLYVRYADDGFINRNTFHANTAGGGGGLALNDIPQGDFTIANNVFMDNEAGGGGAISVFGGHARFEYNLVKENTAAHDGGGMRLGMFGGPLEGNVIISNTAQGDGGGINVFGGALWENNVIVDNRAGGSGGALFIKPLGPDLVHTTLARNSSDDGSAIYVTKGPMPASADVSLINTVFISHTIGISVTAGHTVTVDAVLWYHTPTTVSVAPGGSATVGNEFTGEPAFAADGYHLTAGSAAMDKGVDAGVTVDIDGEPRPAGTGYDLGADELWHKIYLPLVIRNYQP